MLPILGYGLYGYDVLRTGDPLGEIAKDISWAKANPGKAVWKLSGAEDTVAFGRFGMYSAASAHASTGTVASLRVFPFF